VRTQTQEPSAQASRFLPSWSMYSLGGGYTRGSESGFQKKATEVWRRWMLGETQEGRRALWAKWQPRQWQRGLKMLQEDKAKVWASLDVGWDDTSRTDPSVQGLQCHNGVCLRQLPNNNRQLDWLLDWNQPRSHHPTKTVYSPGVVFSVLESRTFKLYFNSTWYAIPYKFNSFSKTLKFKSI
jgi:hypothetical protein